MAEALEQIKPMDRTRERFLVKSAEAVISLVHSGRSPTEALTKVAHTNDLNPQEIARVAEAYNISRTLSHLHSSKGEDRLNSFPLAEAEKVALDLYPGDCDKPHIGRLSKSALYRSEEDSYGVINLIDALAHDERFGEKTAEEIVDAPQASLSTENAPGESIETKLTKAKKVERSIDLAKTKADEHTIDMASLFEKAANDIRSVLWNLPYERIERGLVARHGDIGTKLAEMLYVPSGAAAIRQPRAVNPDQPVYVNYGATPFPSLDALVKSAEAAFEAQAAADTLVQELTPYTTPAVMADYKLTRKNAAFEGTSNLLGNFFGGLSGISAAPTYDKELRKATMQVNNPDHRDDVLRIRTQSMLSNLLQDDVIGKYNPDEVLDRYNEIIKAAPHLSDQPAMMRPVLRRSLQEGGSDPFEVAQWVGTGKDIAAGSKVDAPVLPESKSKGSSTQIAGSPTAGLVANVSGINNPSAP